MAKALDTARKLADKATEEKNAIMKRGREKYAALKGDFNALQEKAQTDVNAANKLGLFEAPVGGFVAGALDSAVKPIGGYVPWSLPVALATAGAGWYTGNAHVIRGAAGMLSGLAYRLGGGLVNVIKSIALLGTK